MLLHLYTVDLAAATEAAGLEYLPSSVPVDDIDFSSETEAIYLRASQLGYLERAIGMHPYSISCTIM